VNLILTLTLTIALALTPKLKVGKVLKKEKKKWSHELKCATITTKTKVTGVKAEAKTFGTADLKCIYYATASLPFE